MTTTLCAIVYEAGTGAETDRILASLADQMQAEGFQLAGTVQHAFERADRCACDMIVKDLSTKIESRISEDRGPSARGCRLDPSVLEDLVASTEGALEAGVDAVIINKFGKQEMHGAGFRNVIATTLMRGIPTIVAVNRTYLDAWHEFAAEFSDELAPNAREVHDWLRNRLPRRPIVGDHASQAGATHSHA